MQFHDLEGFARHKEISGRQNVHIALPDFKTGFVNRGGRRNTGVGHQNINAAKLGAAVMHQFDDRFFAGDIDRKTPHLILAKHRLQITNCRVQPVCINITGNDTGTFLQQTTTSRLTNATGTTGDNRHTACKAFGFGHALQFGFFKPPVFDIKRFLLIKPHIGADCIGTAHHIDRIDVKFTGDPCGGLILGKGQHANARDQVNHRVRVTHRRAIIVLAAVIIGFVIFAIGTKRIPQSFDHSIKIWLCRIKTNDDRADFRAQEMIRAGCPKTCECFEFIGINKFQYCVAVVEMPDFAFARINEAANARHQGRCNRTASLRIKALMTDPAKDFRTTCFRIEPGNRLVNDFDRGVVTFFGTVAPGKKTVAFKNDPFAIGVVVEILL